MTGEKPSVGGQQQQIPGRGGSHGESSSAEKAEYQARAENQVNSHSDLQKIPAIRGAKCQKTGWGLGCKTGRLAKAGWLALHTLAERRLRVYFVDSGWFNISRLGGWMYHRARGTALQSKQVGSAHWPLSNQGTDYQLHFPSEVLMAPQKAYRSWNVEDSRETASTPGHLCHEQSAVQRNGQAAPFLIRF